jgi:hypothetical protein
MTPTRSPILREPRCQANNREWNLRTPIPIVTKHPPQRVKRDQYRHRAESRKKYLASLFNTRVAPYPAVQAEQAVGRELDHECRDQEDRELLPVIGRRPVPEVHDLGDRVPRNYDQDIEENEKKDRADMRRGNSDPGAAAGLYRGVIRRNLRPIPVCSSNHAPLPPRLDEAPDPEVSIAMIRQTLSWGIPGCLCGSPNRHGTGQCRPTQSSGLTIRGCLLDVSSLPRAVQDEVSASAGAPPDLA